MKLSRDTVGSSPVELPTLFLIIFSYALWVGLSVWHGALHPVFWITISAINITLFMSITHEVLHGHPTRNSSINRLLIPLPIAWSLPYERFRDTHIEHHLTDELTDPFDDPESWYVDALKTDKLSQLQINILHFNNTLLGRMLIGPIIGFGWFYAGEIRRFRASPEIRTYLAGVWSLHLVLCGLMVTWFSMMEVPLWQVLVSVYLGHSLLYVRTYLEHQAAPDHKERTVIIEQACPIAFLFLFNNYHFVHHDNPDVPWYRLPGLYRRNREHYLQLNNAYFYRSYSEIFRKYFFHAKEPVFHPIPIRKR